VTTVAEAQALTAAIKDATMAILPASHLSNVEAPDRFSAAVASFLLA
jgi:3-oxoadipate enol-lactonase